MFTHTPLQVCADTAQWLIENGAEIAAVQDSVERLGLALGMQDAECFAMPTGVMLTLVDQSGFTASAVRRISSRAIHLERLIQLDREIGALCTKPERPPLAWKRLSKAADVHAHPQAIRLGAAFFAAGGFGLFFGGGLLDGLAAGMIGLAWQGIRDGLIRRDTLVSGGKTAPIAGSDSIPPRRNKSGTRIPDVFYATLGGFVVVFAAASLAVLFPVLNPSMVSKGALMLLVPGLALVQAIRDLVSGQLVASVSRFADLILTALGIAGGAAGALELVRVLWPAVGGLVS